MTQTAGKPSRWRRWKFRILLAFTPFLLIAIFLLFKLVAAAWFSPLHLPDPNTAISTLVADKPDPNTQIPAHGATSLPPTKSLVADAPTSDPNRIALDSLLRGSEQWSPELVAHREEIRRMFDDLLTTLTVFTATAAQFDIESAKDRLHEIEESFDQAQVAFWRASGKSGWRCTLENGGETWIRLNKLETRWMSRELWQISLRDPATMRGAAEQIENLFMQGRNAFAMHSEGIHNQWPDLREFEQQWGREIMDMHADCLRRSGWWGFKTSLGIQLDQSLHSANYAVMDILLPYPEFVRRAEEQNSGIGGNQGSSQAGKKSIAE